MDRWHRWARRAGLLGLIAVLLSATPAFADPPGNYLFGKPLRLWYDGAPNPEFMDPVLFEEQGFDSLILYMGDVPMVNDEAILVANTYLNAKVGPNTRAFIELPRNVLHDIATGPTQPPTDIQWEPFDRFIDGVITNPHLGGWYSFDEPDYEPHQWATPAFLTTVHDRIRLKSDLPIALTVFACSVLDCVGTSPIAEYRTAADFFIIDSFPFLAGTTSKTADTALPLLYFQEIQQRLPDRPWAFCAQGWGDSPGPMPKLEGYRDATPQEARFQVWSTWLAGGQGITWFPHMWCPPERVASIFSPLAREIERFGPILAGDDLRPMIRVIPFHWVNDRPGDTRTDLPLEWWASRDPLTTHPFLCFANPSPRTVTLRIDCRLLGSIFNAIEIDPFDTVGDAYVVKAGFLSFTMDPYDVKVLELFPHT